MIDAEQGQRFSDLYRIAQNIGGWNADDLEAFGSQPCIPLPVAFWIIAHVVRNPVDLDHEPTARAVEIDNQLADRVVVAELHTKRALAELLP